MILNYPTLGNNKISNLNSKWNTKRERKISDENVQKEITKKEKLKVMPLIGRKIITKNNSAYSKYSYN